MNVRRSISAATATGAAALALVTLSACGGSSAAGEQNKDGKLDVVTSFYPMQFLAEQIGGEHVAVTTLTEPGTEPHDQTITARQRVELESADYVLHLTGVQPAVDDAIKEAGVEHTVDAATLTELHVHGTGGDGHDHGGAHEGETGEHGHEHEGDAHADEHAGEADAHGHEAEEHGDAHEAETEGHSHEAAEGGADPHIWLDPTKYAEVAEGVGESLGKADPDHAADYRKNADALVKKLKALDASFTAGLKNTDTKTFITTHSAFGYLAERYGLRQEGIAGLDPESEPSPARIKELQDVAKRDKVTTVFFETLASDKTAKTLAKDTGLKTDVLDPLEGITDKSAGADYFAVMEANLAALQKALGAK
ncbi:zinc ABC transporter substrate-binding protein [Streptomyces sp. CC53]|uniref:metal ABC transporter substrate-binding protein n=1 Tax=unclassified Streptomyces TaxID=2593676 RepID=UPI0008DDBBF4|nr:MULTISPECIES: metal ABC transporter substrate-binding protein [unclassified Streptomyces]OII64765.1 zinc ABC transporter substrate-binding protein [Streptomyces sp. CC53]